MAMATGGLPFTSLFLPTSIQRSFQSNLTAPPEFRPEKQDTSSPGPPEYQQEVLQATFLHLRPRTEEQTASQCSAIALFCMSSWKAGFGKWRVKTQILVNLAGPRVVCSTMGPSMSSRMPSQESSPLPCEQLTLKLPASLHITL